MAQERDYLDLRRLGNLIVLDCGDEKLWLDDSRANIVLSVLDSERENNYSRMSVESVRSSVKLEVAERAKYFELNFIFDRRDSIEMKQYMLDKDKAKRLANGLRAAISSLSHDAAS